MTEIKSLPVITTDENGDDIVSFNAEHTFADIARWIYSQGGAEDMIFILMEMVGAEDRDSE